MSKLNSVQFSFNGKTLNLFCVVLNGGDVRDTVIEDTKNAFEKLSPYINDDNQVLYIRDIPLLTIRDKYPGGHCYNRHEAMIALTGWGDDRQHIKATINRELHHMARWQNPGYGETLGGAILSEGIATYYEELVSGWTPPWAKVDIDESALKAAVESWDDAEYNHADWFFKGNLGEWVGYAIGYRLARSIFKDGFELEQSVMIKPEEAFKHVKAI